MRLAYLLFWPNSEMYWYQCISKNEKKLNEKGYALKLIDYSFYHVVPFEDFEQKSCLRITWNWKTWNTKPFSHYNIPSFNFLISNEKNMITLKNLWTKGINSSKQSNLFSQYMDKTHTSNWECASM